MILARFSILPNYCRSSIMRISISFAVFMSLFLVVGAVHAHKVNMFAHVEGSQIRVEGYFSDGKPASNSQIQVFAPAGERLLKGVADEGGVFVFDVPQVSDLRITLYAGVGHRAEYTLTEAELAGSAPAGDTSAAASSSAPAASGGVSSSEVDAMVRKAVGEAMLPVVRGLSELREQRGFSDIVGGIGFIVGVLVCSST